MDQNQILPVFSNNLFPASFEKSDLVQAACAELVNSVIDFPGAKISFDQLVELDPGKSYQLTGSVDAHSLFSGNSWLTMSKPIVISIHIHFSDDGTPQVKLNGIAGEAGIFGINFDVFYDLYHLHAGMNNPQGIKLKDFIKSLTGCEIDLLIDDITLASVNLTRTVRVIDSIEPARKTEILAFNIKTSQSLDLFGDKIFTIYNPSFRLQLWDGAFDELGIDGLCGIGTDILLDCTGTYNQNEGFTFGLSLLPKLDPIMNLDPYESDLRSSNVSVPPAANTNTVNDDLPKGDLSIRKLFTIIDSDFPPEFLPNITIDDLEFSINSRTRNVHFKLAGEWTLPEELNIIKASTLSAFCEINTTLGKSADGDAAQIAVGATYEFMDSSTPPEKRDIGVIWQKDSSGNSFSFFAHLDLSLGDLLSKVIRGLSPETDFSEISLAMPKFNVTDFTLKRDSVGNELQITIASDLKFSELLESLGISVAADNPLNGLFQLSVVELDLAYSSTADKSSEFSMTCFLTDDIIVKKYAFKASRITIKDEKALIGNIYGLENMKDENSGVYEISLGSSFPIQTSIKDLFLGHFTKPALTLFGIDLSVRGDVDLSSLPSIGQFLSEAKFSFDALRIVHTSVEIEANYLDAINSALAQNNVAGLVTAHSTNANGSATLAPFPQGFSLQGSLTLGDNAEVIPLHSGLPASTTLPSGSKATPVVDANAAVSAPTPSPVGRKFGPVNIDSVSLGLKDGGVGFTISGGLLLGPVHFEMIGFTIASPIKSFEPKISLHGFALDVNTPSLTLSGLLMETDVIIPGEDEPVEGYSGALSIGYNEYLLTAFGSYVKLPGKDAASIFLYGFLGAPLGGLPGILLITGVAVGFGYNRTMTLPAPDEIDSHPLIQAALGGSAPPDFNAMNQKFMPDLGSYWLAVGIRVESFKMMESFVLLVFQFGHELEIDILGRSHMRFPIPKEDKKDSGDPLLANVLIGLVARILPERGILDIRGQFLTGSYIFNPQASITGGFALLSVFKNQNGGQWDGGIEGDFILTLGGYGPFYTPKPYYPQVARLEMNWKVSDHLQIRVDAYFAITPEAMMVGGHMVGDFEAGGDFSIHVHLMVGADFIVYWKPYHYLAHMYADLNVTASINVDCWLFTIHASVDFDLSADLTIWGPSFSGHASVHVHVLVSFTVGIDFGDPQTTPQPIEWEEFKNSLLPAPEKILSANIGNGLIASQSKLATDSTPAINVVNARELKITFDTAIPVITIVDDNLNLFTLAQNISESDRAKIDDLINRKVLEDAEGTTPKAYVQNLGNAPSDSDEINDLIKSKALIKVAALKNENPFGIKPMAKTSIDISQSQLGIRITRNGAPTALDLFVLTPVTKNMPAAMWQPARDSGTIPDNDGTELINLLTGVTISTKEPPESNPVQAPTRRFDQISMPPSLGWAAFSYKSSPFISAQD